MDLITILVCLIGVAIVISTAWNIFSINQLKRRSYNSNDQLNDSKYYELKYKHEFLIAVVAMLAFVIGFLGYKTKQDIESKLMTDYSLRVDSTNKELQKAKKELKQSLLELMIAASIADSSVKFSQKSITTIEGKQKDLLNSFTTSEDLINKIGNKLNELNSKKILNQEIFVIKDIPYQDYEKQNWQKFYFKDLVNIGGEKLPDFKKIPSVFVSANENAMYVLRNVTKESFEVMLWSYGGDQYSFKFNVLVISESF